MSTTAARPDRRVLLGGAIALALVLIAGAFLLTRPSTGPGPVTLDPDLPPLAADGEISAADLAHDSRDDLYRTP
ncbi:MAG: hypothetical protein ABIQ05_00320, partial [Candidatus Limnocylindria bacterium]